MISTQIFGNVDANLFYTPDADSSDVKSASSDSALNARWDLSVRQIDDVDQRYLVREARTDTLAFGLRPLPRVSERGKGVLDQWIKERERTELWSHLLQKLLSALPSFTEFWSTEHSSKTAAFDLTKQDISETSSGVSAAAQILSDSGTIVKFYKAQRSRAICELAEQLANFPGSSLLEEEGASATAASTSLEAFKFLHAIPSNVALPWASLSMDGEVFLKWNVGKKEASVMFAGHGQIGYALLRDGRFVPGREEATVDSFPSDLFAYLIAV